MENWIYKFAAAIGMTCIIAILALAGYTGINYLIGQPNNNVEYAIILSLIALYQNSRDFINRIWK